MVGQSHILMFVIGLHYASDYLDLAPPLFQLKRGRKHLKWIEETFMTPPNDANDEVLRIKDTVNLETQENLSPTLLRSNTWCNSVLV
jgi:hypothetical protein